jgi:hypothetical protein
MTRLEEFLIFVEPLLEDQLLLRGQVEEIVRVLQKVEIFPDRAIVFGPQRDALM